MALVFGATVLCVAALMGMTAQGQRRRGGSLLLAVVAGVLFPVTWTVWYVRDEHPRRAASRA